MLSYNGFKRSQLLRLLMWWLIHLGPKRDVTVETLSGLLTFSSRDWLIGKYLYVKGGHEEQEIQSAVELLKREGWLERTGPGGTVLNVGANIGMTCVGMVKAGYFERAIAFEPDPENFRLLIRNIDQNGLADRIQPVPCALSSSVGQLTFELSEDNSGDHRVRQVNRPGFYHEERRRTIRVQGETLDHYFADESASVDAVWVDIQGHEAHAFRGGRTFLKRGIPVITEFWPYGIDRAGISPQEYAGILSQSFQHFWVVGDSNFQGAPIADVAMLFEAYSGPRQFCLLVLAPSFRARQKAGGSPSPSC